MPRNYAQVAQQAKLWSMDILLSPSQRTLARSLSDLAEMLSDPQYGCPSEYYAAEVIYCKLLNSVSANRCCNELGCLESTDCPQTSKVRH